MSKGTRAVGGAAKGAATGAAVAGPYGAIVGGALGALGGLFGGGKSAEEKALEELKAAYDQLTVATPAERSIKLEYLQKIGEYSPELQNAILQQDTELNKVSTDPALKRIQMEALARLEEKSKTGLSLEDRAAVNDISRNVAQSEKGRQGAILSEMQRRGMGGSGAELAARLQSSQSSADRASQEGQQVASSASKAAMEALLKRSQQAQEMENTQYNRGSAQATAQDAINRFNQANRQNVANANILAKNEGQKYNLGYARDLEANRVATANEQAKADRDALLGYQNAMNEKILGSAGKNVDIAKAHQATEQRADAGYTNLLGGLGSAASGIKSVLTADTKNPPAPAPTGTTASALSPEQLEELRRRQGIA